jgi:hypothetical protein
MRLITLYASAEHAERRECRTAQQRVQHYPTKDMLSDLFTKALAMPKRDKLCKGTALVDVSR